MGNQISLALAGGVKVLNPTPVDPRMRVPSLVSITNDATYYIGFSPIYSEDVGITYAVAGGSYTGGWTFVEAGGSGDEHSVWEQDTSTSIWVIPHTLNKKPSVQVFDTAGSEVVGHIKYDSDTQITLTFSAPFKGKAILN